MKNKSKKIPIGRTLQTKDEFLKSGQGKKNIKPNHSNKKDLYRRVAVVDSNNKDELAIVKLSTKGRHQITDYLNGKSKYNAYIEIADNTGRRIKIDGIKFVENTAKRDLTKKDINKIKINCLVNNKTSKSLKKDNKSNLRKLKGRK